MPVSNMSKKQMVLHKKVLEQTSATNDTRRASAEEGRIRYLQPMVGARKEELSPSRKNLCHLETGITSRGLLYMVVCPVRERVQQH